MTTIVPSAAAQVTPGQPTPVLVRYHGALGFTRSIDMFPLREMATPEQSETLIPRYAFGTDPTEQYLLAQPDVVAYTPAKASATPVEAADGWTYLVVNNFDLAAYYNKVRGNTPTFELNEPDVLVNGLVFADSLTGEILAVTTDIQGLFHGGDFVYPEKTTVTVTKGGKPEEIRYLLRWNDQGDVEIGPLVTAIEPPEYESAQAQHVWVYPNRVNMIANPQLDPVNTPNGLAIPHWRNNQSGQFSVVAIKQLGASTWTDHSTLPVLTGAGGPPAAYPNPRLGSLWYDTAAEELWEYTINPTWSPSPLPELQSLPNT